jgi:hypothetical protein
MVFSGIGTDIWQESTLTYTVPTAGGGTTAIVVIAKLRPRRPASSSPETQREQRPGTDLTGIYLVGWASDPVTLPEAARRSRRVRCTYQGRSGEFRPDPSVRSPLPIVQDVCGDPISGWFVPGG